MTPAGSNGGDVVGVVLAGGLSRRMGGGDKGLRLLGGVSLLERTAVRLRLQVGRVVLNANGDPARFASLGLPVAADPYPDFLGPLAGLVAGMAWARRHAPQARCIVTAACDTPFFPHDLVAALCAAQGGERPGGERPAVAVAASGGRAHPTFGLWSVALAGALEAALGAGRRKLLDCVREQGGVTVSFPFIRLGGMEMDPFFNINTEEDLALAERFAAAEGGDPAALLRMR